MKRAFSKEELVSQLWNAYKKTPEYRFGQKYAIFEDHRLIRIQEKEGLKAIYKNFVSNLSSYRNQKEELRERNASDWLREWTDMHRMLFGHILINCGEWREENVRFGSPGDEDVYRIPTKENLHNEIYNLADHMKSFLTRDTIITSPYISLAQFHYQFIRIHPFKDGNGRIARAITDQLAIYFGFPPAMGGYPRHEGKKREAYHKAIRAAVNDPECRDLAIWIQGFIETQIHSLA